MGIEAYDFGEQLSMTLSPEWVARDTAVLRGLFPGVRDVRVATEQEDRSGVDFWLDWWDPDLDPSGVDIKHHGVNRRDHKRWDNRYMPELAIEIIANVERGRPGWAMRPPKPDYYGFVWPIADWEIAYAFEAHALHRAVVRSLAYWREHHVKEETIGTKQGWHTTIVFPTLAEVLSAIQGAVYTAKDIPPGPLVHQCYMPVGADKRTAKAPPANVRSIDSVRRGPKIKGIGW